MKYLLISKWRDRNSKEFKNIFAKSKIALEIGNFMAAHNEDGR